MTNHVRQRIEGDPVLRRIWEYVVPRTEDDPAHDVQHLLRVAEWTVRLSSASVPEHEALAAALLHDVVNVSKQAADRHLASERSAVEASALLPSLGFSGEATERIADAIRDHSFSRGAVPQHLLGQALQDADRLDALGAIGILRTIVTGTRMGSACWHPTDPWAQAREWDDRAYMIDHFFKKLFHLPERMNTTAGRAEAERRVEVMRLFLQELGGELGRPWMDEAGK